MKNIVRDIIELVRDKEFKAEFNSLLASSSKEIYDATSLAESSEKFKIISEILITASETLELDLLSSKMLNQIVSALESVRRYRSNSIQLIIHIDDLYDLVMSSGLMGRIINKRDYSKEFRDLANLRAELENTLAFFDNQKFIATEMTTYRDKVGAISTKIEQFLKDSNDKVKNIDSNFNIVNDLKKQAEFNVSIIADAEKDAEEKKLSILTFAKNIEEYKKSIDILEEKSKNIVAKDSKISQLISDAETALNLKSAQGISAAFTSQYNESNNSSLRWWIIGSLFFFLCALSMTIWIVSGYHIKDPTSWSSIIGRVVAVGITVSAATFCANQYRRQKTLAEDYAYKAVLSKSIIAFTKEIKKRDSEKVSAYLTKVLDEIHKDPQRSRTKRTKMPKIDTQALLEKTIEKIPTPK